MTNATVILGVAFGEDYFAAVEFTNGSGGGTIITSPDGVDWSAGVSVAGAALNGVAYAEGLFVAVGSQRNQSVIVTSPSGGVWTTRSAGSSTWLNAVAYGNGHFVVVGLGGAIAESQSVLRLWPDRLPSSGGLQYELSGPSGENCLIHVSTDFTTWAPLANIVLTNGTAHFVDPSEKDFNQRFYRAVAQ